MKKQIFANGGGPDKPSFWEWFWHGKGTVSEAWTTPDELIARPEIQQEVHELSQQMNEHLKRQKSNEKHESK